MFRASYQSGLLTVLHAIGARPLQLWEQRTKSGHIKRITDEELNSTTLEMISSDVCGTNITIPCGKAELGVKLPILVLVVKNVGQPFAFEVQVVDDKRVHRRFHASSNASETRLSCFECKMPLQLDEGWNQVQFNLADFTRRAYGTNYVEALRLTVYASCRLRRVYFADRLYAEEELPREYRLFAPARAGKAAGMNRMPGATGVVKPVTEVARTEATVEEAAVEETEEAEEVEEVEEAEEVEKAEQSASEKA